MNDLENRIQEKPVSSDQENQTVESTAVEVAVEVPAEEPAAFPWIAVVIALIAVIAVAMILVQKKKEVQRRKQKAKSVRPAPGKAPQRPSTRIPVREVSPAFATEVDDDQEPAVRSRYTVGYAQVMGARETQEDSYCISNWSDAAVVTEKGFLAAVADGVGGMNNGQVASGTAVHSMSARFNVLNHDQATSDLLLDLAAGAQVPDDCALVVIAGARSDFSRAETARLDAYLRKGGRMLALMSSADQGGVATLMTAWGIRPVAAAISGARTLSGTDVIVSDFSDHPVCDPLKGSQVIFEKPVAFAPSAAAEGAGADRPEYSELAKVGDVCIAALAERGALAGDDLALRPTRIIAIGDAAFALNGQLAARANANRDFFHNCIAFLSGTDAIAESGVEAGVLVSGMDRAARARFLVASAIVFPFLVFFSLLAFVAYERRRS